MEFLSDQRNRKTIHIAGWLVFLLLIAWACRSSSGVSITSSPTDNASETVLATETKISTETSSPTVSDIPTTISVTTDEPSEAILEYQIVYSLPNHRYDGGSSLYALIDPVDLTVEFESRVIEVIVEIVSEHGNTISIEIYDDLNALTLSYRYYGDMSMDRTFTQAEFDDQARHLIATYDGNLETNIYTNTLMFFPGAFTDTPEVGSFVEILEFDATDK